MMIPMALFHATDVLLGVFGRGHLMPRLGKDGEELDNICEGHP